MITKQKKEQIIKDLSDSISGVKFLAVVNFDGLNVENMRKLRRTLRGINADLKVAKKTLIDLAIKGTNGAMKTRNFRGEVALAINHGDDDIAMAKILFDFSKKNIALKISGGVLDGEILSGEQIIALAKLPSKEQLLSKLLWTLNSPMSGLASVLNGNSRKLVYLLSNIKSNK